MKIQVRDSVFETNSSSSHSVTIAENEVRDMELDKETLRKGIIELDLCRYYGWEWERFYKPENKLSYIVTQIIKYQVDDSDFGDRTDSLREDNFDLDLFLGKVEEFTGCKIKLNIMGGEVGIDHDSHGVGMELIYEDDKLMDFLFSSKSFVELGNDNSGPSEYMDSDIGKIHSYSQQFKPAPRGQQFTLEFNERYGQEVLMTDKNKCKYHGVANFHALMDVASHMKNVCIISADIDLNIGLKHSWSQCDDYLAEAKTQLHELIEDMRSSNGDVTIDPDFDLNYNITKHHDKASYETGNDFCIVCKAPKKSVEKIIEKINDMNHDLKKESKFI
jgi:hypothetical protein